MKKQNLFQGDLQIPHYFEGWYYKQVTADGKKTLSIIFGISTDSENPHAFIQIIENIYKKTHYLSYPLSSMEIKDSPFCVRIKENYFYEDRMILHIEDENIFLRGELLYSSLTPLPTNRYRPTIMGPFSYIKGMECNHGIVSLYHKVEGTIVYQKRKIDFTGGTGYIEKDYGTSFPKNYTWISSTHPENPPGTFFFSVAHIPFLHTSFMGIIGVLYSPKETYYFASYYGAHIKYFRKKENGLDIKLKQGFYTLYIKVIYKQDKVLVAPMKGRMEKKIRESLDATIWITLYKGNKRKVREKFSHGGYENV